MSDRVARSTKVEGDADAKIGAGAGMAFFLVWAVGAVYNGSYIWAGIAFALLCGAYFMGRNSSFLAPCPNCGTPMHELSEGREMRCSGCFLYSRRRGDFLEELDREARLQGKFNIPLTITGSLMSPPLCWKCGAKTASTRVVTGAVDFSQNPLIKAPSTYTLQIGDCGKHRYPPVFRFAAVGGRSGSALDGWDGLRRIGAISAGAKSSAHAALEVDDYGFYVGFLEINGILR